MVEHVDFECLDCAAIEEARRIWHLEHAHKGDVETCHECRNEQFYISERKPLPDQIL